MLQKENEHKIAFYDLSFGLIEPNTCPASSSAPPRTIHFPLLNIEFIGYVNTRNGTPVLFGETIILKT